LSKDENKNVEFKMKVGSTGSTSATQKSRRTGGTSKAAGAGFKDVLDQTVHGAGDAGAVEGPVTLSGVESILAVQSIDPDAQGSARQRMAQHGENILDELDNVRVKMLSGSIPKDQLTDLAKMVRAKREEGLDPRLSAILDEIELRAEVEIAKLTRF